VKKYLFPLLLILALAACKKGEDLPPPNPFDAVIEPPDMPVPEPDSASLLGLHKFIFSQSCSVPGCHDGSFEPDFRTVQSSYSTLVFQPVIKNTPDQRFAYRVKPFSLAESWLHNRVTTEDQVLGRMPLYDNPLTSGQVQALESWIRAGAPDMFGNVSSLPNTQPQFLGLAAFLSFGPVDIRVDSIRDEMFSPFGTLSGRDLTIWLRLEDDSTEVAALGLNELAFSDDPFDFSSARTEVATYSSTPKIVSDFDGPGQDAAFHWKVTVNTGDFPVNALTYLRYPGERWRPP
jgi:hypothetical protein